MVAVELKGTKEPTSVIKIVDENTVSLTNFKVSLSGAGDSRQRVRRYHAHYTFDSSGPPHHPSYLEIYNEKVHDLLSPEVLPCSSLPRRKGNLHKDLRVREHPTQGPYVQNLRRVQVQDVESLLSIVNEGKKHRRTAATRRNCMSSRSHALLELVTPHATLQLAGAERYGECRLKEVNNNGRRNRFVPYRDSVLTWLLRDCFTGGANTFVIATVSPSEVCYSETASTLRWAASALKLPNKPYIPTSADTKAAIQIQYNRLLTELADNHILYVPETGKISFDQTYWILKTDKDILAPINIENIGNIMSFSREKTLAKDADSPPSSFVVDNKKEAVPSNTQHNKEICNEVSEEIDKLFGPAMERTRSSSDFEVAAPLRHKRRQFRSQEMLSTDVSQTEPFTLGLRSDDKNDCGKKISSTTILYDNQRADIIASVTERLYSKLKRKEDTSYKIENAVEKKIVQPLNELKICTNARQRLMEISQKALRNKRKIGIPAYTQTKKNVVRVKDQEIDVQTDLLSYININHKSMALYHRDVATETLTLTPRCKEIGIGSNSSIIYNSNSSTMTEVVDSKHSQTMTSSVKTNQKGTQTLGVRPPRRLKHSSVNSKYLRKIQNLKRDRWACSSQPVININISPEYKEDSTSDDSEIMENTCYTTSAINSNKILPPDLLNNYNSRQETRCKEMKHRNKSNVSIDPCTTLHAPKIENAVGNLLLQADDSKSLSSSCDTDNSKKSSRKEYIHKKVEEITSSNTVGESKFVLEEELSLSSDLECSDSQDQEYTIETASDSSQSLVSSKQSDWMRSNSFRITKKLAEEAKEKLYQDNLKIKKLETNRECYLNCCKNKKYLGINECEDFRKSSQYKYEINNSNNEYDSFDSVERQIEESCHKLESAVCKYECFFDNHTKRAAYRDRQINSPTEYLQHLISLRRELVHEDRCSSLDKC
ncbi:unnamed protein product [Leptidea sinapis]|uniref:Kinesin motor domain-containing protein n=1 Tax=Leptidea sinapis TaxID=189913 RepID=A0A5E4PZA5_9NEOP|nr:unnamed protein product [Leptidea sinapis]